MSIMCFECTLGFASFMPRFFVPLRVVFTVFLVSMSVDSGRLRYKYLMLHVKATVLQQCGNSRFILNVHGGW